MPTISLHRLLHPLSIALMVFLLAAALASAVVWHHESARRESELRHAAVEASDHAQTLQRSIDHSLSVAYTLAALVRQGHGSIADFDKVAQRLLTAYPGAAALALAPGGVMQTIVPLAGNEKSIGHDVLHDPARAREAKLARDSGLLTLAGPFDLIQGGQGAVARLPLYLDAPGGGTRFWGFATVLLRFPDTLGTAQLSRLPDQNLAYKLWRIHPDTGRRQVIAASSDAPLQEPLEQTVHIANANWTLGVAPPQGWNDPLGLTFKIALGLMVSLSLAYISKLLMEQRAHKLGLQALVERRTAEIQAARHQLEATVDAIPDLIWEMDLGGRFHDCHQHQPRRPSDMADGETVSGRFSLEAAGTILAALQEAHETGASSGKQFAQGTAWYELSVARKNNDADGAQRFVVLARDVSERKEAEHKVQRLGQLYAALSQCNQAIVRCTSQDELFDRVCRAAVQFGGMKMAWIGLLDEASMHVVPVASFGDETNYLIDIQISASLDSHFGGGASGIALRTGEPFWCQDFANDPHTAPWHERGAESGWRGVAALPLRREGIAIGVFSMFVGETDAFDAGVRELMTEMATDISFALDNFVREAQRKSADLALRESKARYRAVTQFASDAIVTVDSNGNIASWNCGAEAIFGYRDAEADGQPLTMLMPDRYRAAHSAGMPRAISGEAQRVSGNAVELIGLRKDRSEFALELSLAKWEIAEGSFFTAVIRDITRRKQTETKLRLAAKVFEQSNEGFTITDADRNIVLVNQAFTTITGYSEAEAIGQNPRMLASGRQDRAFYAAMWQSIDTTGHWQGEVWNRRKDGNIYPEWLTISRVLDTDGTLTNYIGIFSDITRHKEAEEHILRLGHFDPLTGLANRILLTDRVNHAISMAQRGHTQLAVLILDLDHFKYVNDTLGHGVGDNLLIEIAARLKAAVREQDTVSRLGGDEFILVLPDTEAGGAAHVAEKLLAAVAETFWIDQYELVVTPSIGIAVYPSDGLDYDTLFKCADAAMYRAKQEGRNHFCFFTAEMQARSARTLQLENALRSALKRDQLLLQYQPQMSIDGSRVVGAEALLRWRHPELGMISPAEFIPIAEESGQILAIGEWVLRSATRQCRDWIEQGLPPLTIAVNLSAVQFRQQGLPKLVSQILDEVQLPPRYLELELTESVAMDNPLDAIAMMNDLHERGVRMSIDDFGTGYSSLSYLKRFRVYKLKIDRSFVNDISSDPDDQVIVDAVISLARSLGLQTIAEGVETAEQLAFLRERGCDEVQGFYFSKPLSSEQFESFVREKSLVNQA